MVNTGAEWKQLHHKQVNGADSVIVPLTSGSDPPERRLNAASTTTKKKKTPENLSFLRSRHGHQHLSASHVQTYFVAQVAQHLMLSEFGMNVLTGLPELQQRPEYATVPSNGAVSGVDGEHVSLSRPEH